VGSTDSDGCRPPRAHAEFAAYLRPLHARYPVARRRG